ncbi:hypothetical protein [Vogesella indigofera]|uniref:hypothetical protein n=1 Tax=Vogesella indigofera TaxID=45465 RepID=UPI00234DE5FC|nr:hypothetical protein [Vogesella indigofera]MDC7704039.1 hypothetical protein [Vogesella indigofera]
MTFLELCQRVRLEAGLSGDGPSAIAGQTGINARLITWVRQAYQDIINRREWDFLWHSLAITVSAGRGELDLAGFYGLTDVGRIIADSVTADGKPVAWQPDYRAVIRRQQGEPAGVTTQWSRLPNGLLVIAPLPAAAMGVAAEYYRSTHALLNDASQPLLPVEYRMAIVWRAVMHYAAHDEAPALWQNANQQFSDIIMQLERTQREQLTRAQTPLDGIPQGADWQYHSLI